MICPSKEKEMALDPTVLIEHCIVFVVADREGSKRVGQILRTGDVIIHAPGGCSDQCFKMPWKEFRALSNFSNPLMN
jgi:hypothetical protein